MRHFFLRGKPHGASRSAPSDILREAKLSDKVRVKTVDYDLQLDADWWFIGDCIEWLLVNDRLSRGRFVVVEIVDRKAKILCELTEYAGEFRSMSLEEPRYRARPSYIGKQQKLF